MQRMKRMTISITIPENNALHALAERERRDPREQAAYLVIQGLRQLGFLEEESLEDYTDECTNHLDDQETTVPERSNNNE